MPYIEPSEIERIKQIDLLTYLQQREPDELVSIGANTHSTKTHDSLKISNGKWYWWSRGTGGKNALDYLIAVKGMSFLEAAIHLGGMSAVSKVETLSNIAKTSKSSSRNLSVASFKLPLQASSNDAVIDYLSSRGIAAHIIRCCIEDGLIYASSYKGFTNAVFVGKDSSGSPRYACVRAIIGNFKGEVFGSDKCFSFKLQSKEQGSVHIFESAIDALSYATLMQAADKDWRSFNLLSLGGIAQQKSNTTEKKLDLPKALSQYLKDNPQTQHVHIHLDSDQVGRAAAQAIQALLVQQGIEGVVDLAPDGYKDINDYLMFMQKKSANQIKKLAQERSR